MIRIHEIKLKAQKYAGQDIHVRLIELTEKKLRLTPGTITGVKIVREAVDARKKPEVFRVFSLDIESSKSDEWLLSAARWANIRAEAVPPARELVFGLKTDPECSSADAAGTKAPVLEKIRPVVIGFGPCGMFAALALAKAGAKPIVLERGGCMEERVAAVEAFWNGGSLDLTTNVQFGEGGAGTFSDGKLTTGTRSPYNRFVLETFAACGAPENILYRQKPHIGTDNLRRVVVNIRKEIEALGGEVRFRSLVSSLEFEAAGASARVTGVILSDGSRIEASSVILAVGHSARDTVRNLRGEGLLMEQKPFSMGVRIEHPQELIDISQYGAPAKELGLEPADYKLNVKTSEGRGVYTFCMCPGGVVVNASSHEGMAVTNGMSNSGRDSGTANSALLCDVRTTDFGSEDPLAGIEFQEKYERLAYRLGGGGYRLPVQRVGNFMGSGGTENPGTASVSRGSEQNCDLKDCLPPFVYSSIKEAIPMLGKKLRGFDSPDALMTAIESRSSSPVRISRDQESLQAELCTGVIEGLYPAGEGAGYAGGIMSAACDGMKVASKIVSICEIEEKQCSTML